MAAARLAVVALLGALVPAAPAPAVAAPCAGVPVEPGDSLQATIDGHRPGTTFCLAPGTYRLRVALVPRSGDVFDGGGRRAILDGAKDITSRFVRQGRLWVAGGQTQSLSYDSRCLPSRPLCREADDVFYDGRPLRRVGSVAQVGPGRFHFDHERDRIYVGDPPAGHRVEATVTREAFRGWGTGVGRVTLRGVVMQHFAMHGSQCRGSWRVVDSESRWNHGDGLQDCGTVLDSYLHHNGKNGYVFAGRIGVTNGPYVFSRNVVSANNYAGFDPEWEAGGAKFMQMARLTVSGNRVVGNRGNGLWTDWGNRDVVYEGNIVADNTDSGILHEASYDATISGNRVTGNGSACSSTLCDAGILLNDSQNVEIFGNTLSGNRNGIGLTQIYRGATPLGPLVTEDVSVHDNAVSRSGRSGLVQWDEDASFYTTRGNRFFRNSYAACGVADPFVWQDPAKPRSYTTLTWAEWQAAGNDTAGSSDC